MNVDHEALNDEQRQQVRQILTDLEAEEERIGWDQPAKLWMLVEAQQDVIEAWPTRMLEGPFEGMNPGEAMERYYEMGARVPPYCLGLVLSMEGWRHRHLSEVEAEPVHEADHELIANLATMRAEMRRDNVPDKQIEKVLSNGYYRLIIGLKPSDMPAEMRREFRTLIVVVQTGESAVVGRTRGGEPDAMNDHWQPKENTMAGRVTAAMFRLLSWQDVPDTDAQEILNRAMDRAMKED